MRGGKRTVKRLYTELRGIFRESALIHERDGTQPPNIGVVESSAVVEVETHRRIVELRALKIPVVDQQSAGEPRLYDDSVAGVEIDHHQLGAAPAAGDPSVAQPSRQRTRADFAQDVRLANGNLRDFATADRAVEIARDRLGLR